MSCFLFVGCWFLVLVHWLLFDICPACVVCCLLLFAHFCVARCSLCVVCCLLFVFVICSLFSFSVLSCGVALGCSRARCRSRLLLCVACCLLCIVYCFCSMHVVCCLCFGV